MVSTLLLTLQMAIEPVENDGLEGMIELAPHRGDRAVRHKPGPAFLLNYFQLTTHGVSVLS